MIRLILNSIRIKLPGTHSINNNLAHSSQSMVRRNLYSFAIKNHPTIQKIIKEVDEAKLDSLYSQIGALNQKNRELALKLILKKVYISKLPLNVITNEKLKVELAKNPQILVEALLFKIKQSMKILNQNVQRSNKQIITDTLSQINKSFVQCFDNLKKIPTTESLKTQVMLHKRFADYHLFYLSKLVDSNGRQQILKKSIDFYKNINNKAGILIIQTLDKINLQNQKPQTKNQNEEEKQWKLNAMKQNLRMLIETNSENILHLYYAEKELKLKNVPLLQRQSSSDQFKQSVIYLSPLLQKAIQFYQLIGKINAFSIFYHKLKKILIEINFYSKISGYKKYGKDPNKFTAFQAESRKQMNTEIQTLYNETVQDLKTVVKEPNHLGNIQQLSILLFSLRMSKINEHQHDADLYKEKIFEQVKKIIALFTNQEDKKVIIASLSKLVKQLISGQNILSKRKN